MTVSPSCVVFPEHACAFIHHTDDLFSLNDEHNNDDHGNYGIKRSMKPVLLLVHPDIRASNPQAADNYT